MNYKLQIPDIANRLKFCVTDEAKAEFFRIELQNAFDNGWQEGFTVGMLQGQLTEIEREVTSLKEKLKPIPEL